jgi:hypothetical protein
MWTVENERRAIVAFLRYLAKVTDAGAALETAARLIETYQHIACRMDAKDRPECWCGAPSTRENGLCGEHASPRPKAEDKMIKVDFTLDLRCKERGEDRWLVCKAEHPMRIAPEVNLTIRWPDDGFDRDGEPIAYVVTDVAYAMGLDRMEASIVPRNNYGFDSIEAAGAWAEARKAGWQVIGYRHPRNEPGERERDT